MKYGLRLFTAAAAMALLAGCGTQLQKAEMQSASGAEFQKGLHDGYLSLSESEYEEGDYLDSDYFAQKAMAAGEGGSVEPTQISERTLPSDKADMLSSARGRLTTALADGGADKAPADAARAQTMFDCWMQEQEENFQPGDIEGCKGEFFAALGATEKALEPPPVAAAPEAAPKAEQYVVYFDLDSDELNPAAKSVLAEAEAAAAKLGGKVVVSGYADTTGTSEHNLKLSEKRAVNVVKALGTSAKAVETNAFGEHNLAVPTDEGVPEPRNRRAVILVTP